MKLKDISNEHISSSREVFPTLNAKIPEQFNKVEEQKPQQLLIKPAKQQNISIK